jgi:hypothetical protein
MHISVSCPVLSDHAKTFIDILYVVSADWGKRGGGGDYGSVRGMIMGVKG